MANNCIRSISDSTIFMPLLEVLNLQHNEISDIDNNNDNGTQTCSNSVWRNFPFLIELYLAYNKIETLQTFDTISSLCRLRVLEVQNNPVFDTDRMSKLRYH